MKGRPCRSAVSELKNDWGIIEAIANPLRRREECSLVAERNCWIQTRIEKRAGERVSLHGYALTQTSRTGLHGA